LIEAVIHAAQVASRRRHRIHLRAAAAVAAAATAATVQSPRSLPDLALHGGDGDISETQQ